MNQPAKPRRFAGYGSVQVERAREEGRKKRAREAQEAFERGQDALLAGQTEEGFFWFSRSERLTRGCGTATLASATAALTLGKLEEALPRLQKLRALYDLPEAAYGEVLCLVRMGRTQEAARAMQQALNHLPLPDVTHTPFLASQLAWVAGCPGWATLSNDSTLLLRSAEPVEVSLDGRMLGHLSPGQHKLNNLRENGLQRWQEGQTFTLRVGGRDVLGSPFDLVKLTHSDSLVIPTKDGLAGWLWHPAEPNFQPELLLVKPSISACGQEETQLKVLEGVFSRQENESAIFFPVMQRALAKPWFFTLPQACLPFSGPVSLCDTHGRRLKGVPIDPALGQRGPIASFVPAVGPLPASVFSRNTNNSTPSCRVILPVHNGGCVTQECLRSVLTSVTPDEAELIVVDDASTEGELVQWLSSLAATGRITLLRNTENQGFVRSVNRGLRFVLEQSGEVPDVVLLNSDTTVFSDWLLRLRQWLRRDDVGTATPFSNAGGQLSWPSVKSENALPGVEEARRLDQLCAQGEMPENSVTLVTGNGFCMGISAACLAQTGLLREDVFAQGYGEENDFCCRASALGFRHVAATNVFVRHIGSVSFGPGRWGLLARNVRFVEKLHPGYLKQVKAFEQKDPLSPARRILSELWLKDLVACRGQDSVLLIQHEAGGGVARAVRERGVALEAEGTLALTLTPTAEGCRLALVEGSGQSLCPELDYRLPQEAPHLVEVLKELRVAALEWHHLIGHAPWVRQLHEQLGVPYDVYVHDHVWFCPRIALLTPEGQYCGEPDLAGCLACVERGGMVLEEEISIPDLRARSARELAAARQIIAPSRDAARRFERRFPGCGPIMVRPLQKDEALLGRPSRIPRKSVLRVGVVGGLSQWKGSDLLLELARYVQTEKLPLELVLIGTSENDAALIEAGVEVTGEYEEKDALHLVKNAQLHLGFLPSLAPETWCYALEWLWRAGLGVACFDIGAVPERIRALEARIPKNGSDIAPKNYILPLSLPVERIASFFLSLTDMKAGKVALEKRS